MRAALEDPAVVKTLDPRYVDGFLDRQDLVALFVDVERTFKDVPTG